MKIKPDISFLIPVHNMADTLPETLESLARVREFPFEIIVIDDGSTDSLEGVLDEWRDRCSRRRNIRFGSIRQENRGRAYALNEGVRIANACYLSFVDADDLVDPVELRKIRKCIKSRSGDLILGQFKVVTATGREMSRRLLDYHFTKKQLIRRLLFWPLSPVHLNAFLIRREYFLSIGGMDTEIIKSQDKDVVFRLLKGTDSIQICNSCHYLYRKYPLSRMLLLQKRCEWFFYRQKMIRKNFSGFTRYSSMFLQGVYDLAKLFYEGVFKYRI